MSEAAKGGDFTSNLGKVYGIYTGGFLAFVIFLYILERSGVSNTTIGYLFVAFTIFIYAAIGVMSRTMDTSEYYVAGRKVPSLYNGMATAADWMSAASFIGMAGTLYLLGYDGLAFILGWTGGYVLVATLIAPFLRKFGCYTIPDFLAFRFNGNLARTCGIIVLMSCSFTYVVAQIVGTGLIGQRLLGMSFETAVFVGLVGILVCSMLGGMRAVTWTQVAQYIVLIIAYLVPVVMLSAQKFGLPVPQLTYGQVIAEITAREGQLVQQGLAAAGQIKPHALPGFADGIGNDTQDWWNFFTLILCLMIGTASLPHVLMRYFTTPSVREARSSVAWTLLFIFILYFTAPAYAAFAKLEVYQSVIGKNIGQLPAWIFAYGKVGLVSICGAAASSAEAVAAACAKLPNHAGILRFSDFAIQADAIVIATPEIAGLPYVVAGLVAAGGLAAALSTADGLLLAIANALSHDVYSRMIDKNAPASRKLIVARVLLIGVAILAAYVASFRPADIVAMVAWAFSLAAAGLFPALVLGIWWKRCTWQGAVAGMIAGFGLCLYYLVGTRYYAPGFYETWSSLSGASAAAKTQFDTLKAAWMAAAEGPAKAAAYAAFDRHAQIVANWWGIRNISCATFGLPVGFAVMIIVSLMTPAPSKELQDFIDDVRRPKGKSLMGDQGSILGH
jgi:cation/acetate symporter